MNIGRIASAATAQKLNTLRLSSLGKLFEGASRELNSLHFIRELRQTGEARSRVSGPERRRLRGNRNSDRLAHLPSDCQHAIGFLLTIDAYGSSARIYHGSGAVRR